MKIYIKNLVSVIVPSYKRAEKLERAIKSVLNQSYENLELLIINDNNPWDNHTKELKRIISLFEDNRLILINQEKHTNGAIARNLGIKKAVGEYIAFLDDDDFWDTIKIQRQVDVLSNLDYSWGGVSTKKKEFFNNQYLKASLPYKSGNIYKEILLRRVEVSTSTLLIRHKALDETGYFDEELNRHQELQLLAFFTIKYKIKLVNEYLHNVDVSDSQNRPNIEKLQEVKKDFFTSVRPIVNQLSIREQKHVFIMHDFELGYAMMKNKEIKEGLIKILSIFKSPFTFYYALERSTFRIVGKILKKVLLRRR